MLRGSALCILPSDSGFADEQTKCNSLRRRVPHATRSRLSQVSARRTPNVGSAPKVPRRQAGASRKRPRWGPRNAARRFGRMPEYLRSPVDRIAARAICTVRCAAAREFAVPYLSLRSLPSPNRAAGEPASRDRARRDTPCEGSRGRPLGRAGRSNIENPAAESDVECISPEQIHRIHQQQQECSFAPRLSNEAGVCFCGQLI